ncbi:MAG: hypothetical protein AVDCRST_MAG39-640 [uncultured Sphingomonadaceae bacterium]|uniref:Transmembrane protein n=1 Tax=uncultured Sphingomonadaceae bacterium TaxID=169976 RepID=A0A6J4S4W1_9SPHN|nr:MAG: hypothetical protein AVDCRST_MAG39-640 [uncultured Sphingomonadaceae bacterium]
MRDDARAEGTNRPAIVAGLYLVGLLTGLPVLIGAVLALVWRGEAADWERSHYSYLLRTFGYGVLATIVGAILMVVLVGFLVMGAAWLWMLARSLASLVRALERRPMPEPRTLLV